MSGVGWMMELALAGKYELREDPLTIENGALQVGKHEKMIGGVYLLANALLQEETVRNTVLDQEEEVEPGGGDNVIHEREDDDFEKGLIPLGAAMPRGRGGAEPVGTPLRATRQRTRMRTRREDRPPVFRGGNIELFLMEFERHAREFGWDSTKMLREVRGVGEWADPIAKMVRESLSWQDFGRRMEVLHPSPLGRDGQPIRFDSTNLGEFLWAYDRYADELGILGEQSVGSFLLFVRHHIRPFVRSIVAFPMNWGHCKKLLWNYYTPARQAGERRGVEKRKREPGTEARGTFEQGASPGAQREEKAGDLKRELDRQGKELTAVKADMESVSAENEAVRQVNQTLNKVTDALRAYLCAQLTFFQVKETEWEKRIRDLEAKYTQQAPTRVVDWAEVQKFEIREQPAEEVLKREKEVEMADQQEDEKIPLIDKEMLEQPGVVVGKGAEVGEFEWRLPVGLTLGHEPAVPQEGLPVEAMRVGEVPPTIRKETAGQQEGQESVGQTMVGTEQRVDLRDCQKSTMLQEVPVATDLRDVVGYWATGSGSEGRVGEPGMPADDRAACPASSGVPQQEVTSKISTTPSSVPSLEGEKMTQKKLGKCFYCKRGKHRSDDCPKSLKDEANELCTRESSGVWRDRNRNLVPKTHDGVRAQLYRQLQGDMSDQE
ncbi:hypothetical protein CBR_g8284 [Chara braunii]|uniref:Uncharacterized protein n=1 Tax=Chara braunii TaxID=69332 RepID=A0A388KLQ0_CHABU|nr:hypothetical protein CBR_g8284 [Chara braunii]|eukprot:GBG70984.1 hypothetical protein CBR_g8284 [Chara braunii]